MSKRFLIPICLLLILSSALGQDATTTATAAPDATNTTATTTNTTTTTPPATTNTTTTTPPATTNTTTTTPPATTNTTTTTPPATTNTTTTNTTTTTPPVTTNVTTPTTPTITVNSSQSGQTTVVTTPANTSIPATTSTITFATLQGLEKTGANIASYPTQDYTLYLVDIHFISGNLSAQYIAHHYCHFVSEDMMQCALYNDSTPNARFIGNEYFITKALFDTLDTQERHLWHSHPFEVQSGLFVAPDLSENDEFTVMEWLMGTFGKVADTWQYFNTFPLGAPQLGMALALESQVNWTLAGLMDQQLNLKTTYQQRQQDRAELVAPPASRAADSYLITGNATQYKIYEFAIPNHGKNLTTTSAATNTTTTTPAGNSTTTTTPSGNSTNTTTPAGSSTTTTTPAGNSTTTTTPAGNSTTTTTPATSTTTTPDAGTNATTTTTTTPPANVTTTPVSTV